ncbi:hypothetical protein IV80_GL001780 [Pediococcus cellicola]|uniref:Uncharacterized protein n=1 Tax=Pediococcus cellicola TaxID=319652 RepID=A0A0R2ILT4_9LACO|nr:hypothetical protein IV80_GL001780 [Pediococcus cellicola]
MLKEAAFLHASSCGLGCGHKNGHRPEHKRLLANWANNHPLCGVAPVLAVWVATTRMVIVQNIKDY